MRLPVADGAERDAIVSGPQSRIPLGIVYINGSVFGQYRSERLEVVNVERVFGCGMCAALLTRSTVAPQYREPPLPVSREAADHFRGFCLFPLKALRRPRGLHAVFAQDFIEASRRDA